MLNPYERSAEVYDVYYSWLDYEAHAQAIHELIAAKRPTARSVLDVACGTGRYAEQLARWYDVEGLDISEAMLTVAHRRLPETTFHLADMIDFDLGQTYDALVCLFSSIAYVTSHDDLAAMIRSCRRHLEPGGVLIIEPWITPEAWMDRHIGTRVVEGDGLAVARVDSSVRDRNRVTMRWAWAVAWEDGDADAYVEEHPTALFGVQEYLDVFLAERFVVEHDPGGPLGRGLYVAVKV